MEKTDEPKQVDKKWVDAYDPVECAYNTLVRAFSMTAKASQLRRAMAEAIGYLEEELG